MRKYKIMNCNGTLNNDIMTLPKPSQLTLQTYYKLGY